MTDNEAKAIIESFIGRMRTRMSHGGNVAYVEFADVTEALYCLIQQKKDK